MSPPIFHCDGCGRAEPGTWGGRSGGWHKPDAWYARTIYGNPKYPDWPTGELVACSRPCIERAAQRHGTDAIVSPI